MDEPRPPVSARVVRVGRESPPEQATPPGEPPAPSEAAPVAGAAAAPEEPAADELVRLRAAMVRGQLAGRDIADPRVLAAMGEVAREAFVLPEDRSRAYDDTALSIGHGQTISQPYMVALQLELLELGPDDRLLEVGGGSGYAAAVAARLVREVVTTERIGGLAARAARTLERVGAANATVLAVDGSRGVAGRGPFDAILVSCATERLPARLYGELAEGGRLVVPIGDARGQRLELVRRGPDGAEVTHSVPCRFVPLITGSA